MSEDKTIEILKKMYYYNKKDTIKKTSVIVTSI